MYTALLLAVLAANGLAAPSTLDRREATGYNIEIHAKTTRQHHPNHLVRRAWVRDQAINARLRTADDFTTPEGRAMIQRDMEFVERSVAESAQLDKRAQDIEVINWGRDYVWAVPISIGTPPQSFDISIDTGSSDTWVRTVCDISVCKGAPTYNPTQSSTFINATGPNSFSVRYGGGEVRGYKGADRVALGNQWVSTSFGLITRSTSLFTSGSQIAGLMGLAWPAALSNGDLDLVWRRFMPSDSEAIFSFYLPRDPSPLITWALDQSVHGGVLTLGGTDPQYYTGDINYLPLTQDKKGRTVNMFWLVELDGMKFNGKDIDTSVGGAKAKVLMDSGTTMLGGPRGPIEEFYKGIEGAQETSVAGVEGFYMFPCQSLNQSNYELSFNYGGVDYPVQKWDLVATTEEDKSMCRGSLYVLSTNEQRYDWIFGGAFLKNIYSVHRMEPPSFGLAKLQDKYNQPLNDGKTPASESAPPAQESAAPNKTATAEPTTTPNPSASSNPDVIPNPVEPHLPDQPASTTVDTTTSVEPTATSSQPPLFDPTVTQGRGEVDPSEMPNSGTDNSNSSGDNNNDTKKDDGNGATRAGAATAFIGVALGVALTFIM